MTSEPQDDAETELHPNDAVVLDVLLAEVLGGKSPPDQTRVILQRMREEAAVVAPLVTEYEVGSRPARRSSNLLSLCAVAAGMLIMVGIGFVAARSNLSPLGVALVESASPDPANDPQQEREAGGPAEPSIVATGTDVEPSVSTPRRPIELAAVSPGDDTQHAIQSLARNEPAIPLTRPSLPNKTLSVQRVSRQIDDDFGRYWKRMHVSPTALTPAEVTAKQLQSRLGLRIPVEAIGNPQSIQESLMSKLNRKALAIQLLSSWSGRSTGSFDRDADQERIAELSYLLSVGYADRLLYGWLKTSWPAMVEPVGEHTAVVQTAATLFHQDLRCQRCHESPGQGDVPTQSEYWQFAGWLRSMMKVDPNQALPNESSAVETFFSAADGRQKMVLSGIPEAWSDPSRKALAKGLTESIWKMVHGRDLQPSNYDFSSAPPDDALRAISDVLANDLVESGFDLLRTIALVIASPVTGRSVPTAISSEGMLASSDSEIIQAMTSIDTMAAGSPHWIQPSYRERLLIASAQVKTQLNDTLRLKGGLLAQPIDRQPKSSRSPKQGEGDYRVRSVSPFPTRAMMVTPAWLSNLPSLQSRLHHMANLAGKLDLDAETAKLAQQMADAGVDESLILQRVWWIIGS